MSEYNIRCYLLAKKIFNKVFSLDALQNAFHLLAMMFKLSVVFLLAVLKIQFEESNDREFSTKRLVLPFLSMSGLFCQNRIQFPGHHWSGVGEF